LGSLVPDCSGFWAKVSNDIIDAVQMLTEI